MSIMQGFNALSNKQLLFMYLGDQELIRNFAAEMLEGKLKYSTRGDYVGGNKRLPEIVDKFLTVDKFFELNNDPLKHFRDDARVTDSVSILIIKPLAKAWL